MAGFLYFIETEGPVTNLDKIAEFGLSYAFDDFPTPSRLSHGTPTGKPGFLLADESRMGEFVASYRPREQTWRVFGNIAIGYYNDAKPMPQELLRSEWLDGPYVTLSDGNDWIIPTVYLWEDSEAVVKLPKCLDVDESGNWVDGDVVAKYAPLIDRLWPFFESWCDAARRAIEDGDDFTVKYDIDDCTAIIATNYRVSPRELAMLQAIRKDKTAAVVLFVACDLATALDYLNEAATEKKSGEPTPDSSDTAAGHAA